MRVVLGRHLLAALVYDTLARLAIPVAVIALMAPRTAAGWCDR
ncbi:hypothetical protein [Nonomuraea soli]|uniref:Uncharacterized protein n=1 Tax=Nonomuraea soli TaxID=1032476 RepID=A0A7W0HTY6_9ACTN|nr:hypothetical protein [Nonomuraea soli]MBA2895510.1 hypothetical protein [Nonomuraea soli]